MAILICAILFGLLILDISLIGFLPKVLNIWPSIRNLKDNVLIEDTAFYSIKTNIIGKNGKPIISKRINYKSIILTPDCLIVRNTFFTYLLRIDTREIKFYDIHNKLIGKIINLHIIIEDKEYFFQVRTKQSENWIKEFARIGITEKKN